MAKKPARKQSANKKISTKTVDGRRNYSLRIDEIHFGGKRRRKKIATNKKSAKNLIATTSVSENKTSIIENKTYKNRNDAIKNVTDSSNCSRCFSCVDFSRIHRLENFFILFAILLTITLTVFAQNNISALKQEIIEKIKNALITNVVPTDAVNNINKTVEVKSSAQSTDNKNNMISTPVSINNDQWCNPITVINNYYDCGSCITMQPDFSKPNTQIEIKKENEDTKKIAEVKVESNNSLTLENLPMDPTNIDGIIIGNCESFKSLFAAAEKKGEEKNKKQESQALYYGTGTIIIPPATQQATYNSGSLSFSQSYSGSSSSSVCCAPSAGSMAIFGCACFFTIGPFRSR